MGAGANASAAHWEKQRLRVPEPKHRPFEAHPTINSELLYFIRHGEIFPKPDLQRWEGKTVTFVDGTQEDFDAIIAATGFETSYPYLPGDIGDSSGTEVPLYLKLFHPKYEDLFFIGLFQPLGCIWPLAEVQGRLVAKAIQGEWQRPKDTGPAIRRELDHPDYAYSKTPRHAVEVDYYESASASTASWPAAERFELGRVSGSALRRLRSGAFGDCARGGLGSGG